MFLPLVFVRKKDGGLYVYGDYKIGVNDKICADSYSIPKRDEHPGEYWSTVGIPSNNYWRKEVTTNKDDNKLI